MSLPQGWIEAKLGELTSKIGSGATPRGGREAYGLEGTPLIRSMNVHFDGFRLDGLAFIDDAQAKALANVAVEPNDVLLNITGASIGRVCLAPDDMAGARVNQHVCIIRLDEVEQRFIQAFLAAPEMQQFVLEENYGLTRQALTKGMIEDISVPLPSLAEQRRIVAKLDALTTRLARARAELDRVPVLARKLRQTAMAACFDCKSDNSTTLGNLLRGIESGKNLRCEERPPRAGEKGVIKVSAVTWGRFDPEQSKTLPCDYTPPEKARIKQGDLLISRANTLELVGAPVLVEEQPDGLFLSDKVLRLVLPEEDKRWVHWFLRSPAGREQIESLATGNQLSMRNISQDALRRISMPYPHAGQRAAGIAALEAAFARADRLEAESARARALLDRLESAILAKAFRGELVSQDPNDEPAQALLDRIRGQRAAAPQAKRGRKARVTA